MPARCILAVTALLATGVVAPALAQAPSNPSAAAIVKSLTPTAGLGSATRGIRIGNPAVGRAAPAADATRPASVSLNVHFATGSATLTPEAIHTLDELGRALTTPALASYHFRIEGHTDTVGNPDLNKSLSERRADAVVSYLTRTYQIDAARLQAVGMGEKGLLVATPDQTPEVRNRRVLVVNVGS